MQPILVRLSTVILRSWLRRKFVSLNRVTKLPENCSRPLNTDIIRIVTTVRVNSFVLNEVIITWSWYL